MPRHKQGHSSITDDDDCSKKTIEACIKNSDADEKATVCPSEAKTMPTTTVSKNIIRNGSIESMDTFDIHDVITPIHIIDPLTKYDRKEKFESFNAIKESTIPSTQSDCIKSIDKTSISAFEDTGLPNHVESVSTSSRQDIENVEATAAFQLKSIFLNGDTDKPQSELNSQMSGLWPGVSASSCHSSESHQLSYRLSTTVIETKINSVNEGSSKVVTQNSQLATGQKNFRLPSSVYGPSVSNIEKVLTGLQFASENAEKTNIENDILRKSGNTDTVKDTVIFKNSTQHHLATENSYSSTKLQTTRDKETDVTEKSESESTNYHKKSQSKLKIHIPEISGSESSESLVPENRKVLKFPKITSPQILEQHISKIISENAAIVNTLDPLWSKQYMRQSSYSQGSDTETKKTILFNKLRRVSEDKPTLSSPFDSNTSKLQSALLGTLEHKNTICSGDTVAVPYVPLPSLTVSLSMTSPCTPTYTLPKVVTSIMEEELKGSAIKSLLSLKQGRLSDKNVLKFDKEKLEQHPQNPEGSIIKDLLLKTKSKTKLVANTDSEKVSGFCQNVSSENKHMCSCCGLKFLSQDILEAHNAICKGLKNNKFTSKIIKNSKANGTHQLNTESADKVQVSLPILNPIALSNSIEVLLKKENSLDNINEDVGPILKKQLLSPFNNQKESISKKRKLSDSFLSTNKLLICEEQKEENSCESTKSMSKPLEKITVLSQRSRSQSVHLFGGEVQILDGCVTKKIKISTSLSETLPSTTKSVLDNMSHAKCSFYKVQEVKTNNSPLQTVIVTIAQPVHNSGGTVIHIPTQDSPPSLTSFMNLPSDVSSNDTEKGLELSPNTWGSIFPMKDLSPSLVNSNKTSIKKSVIQKPLNATPVSELQSCRPFSQPLNVKPMTFSFKPIRENSKSSFSALTKPSSFSLFGKGVVPLKSTLNSIGAEKMQVLTAESDISGKPECKSETMPFQYLVSRSIVRNAVKSSIPKVLLTPSSPHSMTDEKQDQSDEDGSSSAKSRKLLTLARPNPMRPNSLPLTKKPFTMVGSTLISPETPRPKKACVQLYINGHAYTYLGLKCSTRSTYCCIYRPQPMFVLQETDPKLSMYSNWQVVPSKEELEGLTPGQMISLYTSKQTPCNSEKLFTTARTGELLSFTHSSYWTFRSKERDKNEAQSATNTDKAFPDYSTAINMSGRDSPPSDFIQSSYGSIISDPFLYSENGKLFKRDGRTSSVSDNTSSLEVEASLSDADINNSQDEDEDDDDDERTDVLTDSSQSQAPKRVKIFEGGFKSNEDYTYVRGRGRGKYVCEECGIRCKKPSMLKKHIRTHTDLRPYKCRHCSFAFKTKGNLTKHMKSKAHHKKCTELGIIPVPTSTEDCQIDQEALAKQEQLKRRNQPFSDGESPDEDDDEDEDDFDDSDGLDEDCESDNSSCIMSMNTNSKLSMSNLQEAESSGSMVNALNPEAVSTATQESILQRTVEQEAARSLLHLSSLSAVPESWPSSTGEMLTVVTSDLSGTTTASSVCLTPVTSNCSSPTVLHKGNELSTFLTIPDEHMGHRPRSYSADVPFGGGREHLARQQQSSRTAYAILENVSKEAAESSSRDANPRRYSISVAREARRPRSQTVHWGGGTCSNLLLQKWPEMESAEQPMDLRVPRSATIPGTSRDNIITLATPEDTVNVLNTEIYLNESFTVKPLTLLSSQLLNEYDGVGENNSNGFSSAVSLQDAQQSAVSVSQPALFYSVDGASISTARKENDPMDDLPSPEVQEFSICSPVSPSNLDDNCYTPENIVPSPSLTDVLQNPPQSLSDYMKPGSSNMEEGKCVCRICNKIFAKAGQLRIHVNIHYFERPFRCDNCGVSFRTKGHLQKHKRSVSHYNKVNMNMTFGTPSIDNPRPFKCADCKIAFRIHGHLAKHLRSKMHIMKLECLGKLPFGMYAEMERSGVSLNEIDTTDCNNSLESLQMMAQKLYQRDPRRMRWHSPTLPQSELDSSTCPPSTLRIVDAVTPVPDPLPTVHSSPSAIAVPVPSTVNLNIPVTNPEGEVKREPSDVLVFPTTPVFTEAEIPAKTPTVLFANQNIAISSPQPLVRANGSETETNTALHRSDTCHICGRMFKSAKFLQVHLYCDHSSWNPSSGEVTTSAVIAESTSNVSGAVAAQELTCDLCGRNFSNQNSLQQHLLTHAQPRPFVCEVCDAGFTSSSSLVAHLATHQHMSSSNAASTEGGLLQLQ